MEYKLSDSNREELRTALREVLYPDEQDLMELKKETARLNRALKNILKTIEAIIEEGE